MSAEKVKAFVSSSLKEWNDVRFFHGATHIEEERGGLVPRRLPNSIYDQIRDHAILAPRARGGSGIRLCFATNATRLEFAFRFSQPSTTGFYDLSLFKDGDFQLSFGPEATVDNFHFSWVVGEKPTWHEIETWWPLYGECHLLDIRANEGATFSSSKIPAQPILLCTGDSITQGSFSQYPHQSYAAVLAKTLGYSLHNWGIGGAILEPMFGGARDHVSFDAAMVAFGTNDFGGQRSLMEFRLAAEELLTNLRRAKPRAPLIVLTPLPRTGMLPQTINNELEEYRKVLREAAQNFSHLLLIEGAELFPKINEPGTTKDGLHPTGRSHQIIGERLAQQIAPFLRSRGD